MGSADNPEIQEMWAGLMANAMDPNKDVPVEKSLVKLLDTFSSADVLIIKFLVEHALLLNSDELTDAASSLEYGKTDNKEWNERLEKDLRKVLKKNDQALEGHFERYNIADIQSKPAAPVNLSRLGIIELGPLTKLRNKGSISENLEKSRYFFYTSMEVVSSGKQLSLEPNPEFRTELTIRVSENLVVNYQLTFFGAFLASACGLLSLPDKSS